MWNLNWIHTEDKTFLSFPDFMENHYKLDTSKLSLLASNKLTRLKIFDESPCLFRASIGITWNCDQDYIETSLFRFTSNWRWRKRFFVFNWVRFEGWSEECLFYCGSQDGSTSGKRVAQLSIDDKVVSAISKFEDDRSKDRF